MHPCGHSSVRFLWSCDTRAQDSFSLFKLTRYFQNTFFYQFVHLFESILGVRENFHSIHPSAVYTFFQKLVMISKFFFQRKVGSHLFSQACCFLARQLFIIIFFFFSSFFFFSCLLFFFFSFLLSFFKLLSFIHFLSLFFFFSLKRSCGRGRTLPTYV